MKEVEKQGDLPRYLFHKGENFTAYDYLGAHRLKDGGVVFRVWAPRAQGVYLVCDTLGWETGREMQKLSDEGIWETTLSEAKSPEGMRYKFRVVSAAGVKFKSDPYAFYSETLQKNASILYTRSNYTFKDEKYLEKRRKIAESGHYYPAPLNIYEVHLASFMTKDGMSNEDGEHYLNYRELAKKLGDYVQRTGYTHVELLPITEYPYDGSWGYQVCGYFAPTSRFGSPDDFKYFVDELHKRGIGVILDWVPAHFPKDEHGLYEFDGAPLYEYSDIQRMEQPSWGTRCFDVARNEVRCFLISSALYWLRTYHVDGLRIDAVASMLYLDYDRMPGYWTPNIYGGKENLESIEFFKRLNTAIHREFPDVLTIAEESTAFPKVTGRVEEGGLGFSMKWNMGWANDMFRYVACDPVGREDLHSALTFPMMYAFSEHYVLPVSHDEVVHGKKSLIDKMFGSYEQKFSGIRLFFLFQMTFPGKKLTFMGCEFGQFREWDYKNPLEWFLLRYPSHDGLRKYSAELNRFYRNHPQLFEDDYSWNGFQWINADLAGWNLISYTRKDLSGKALHVVLNFSGSDRKNYWLEVPKDFDTYKIVFTSDKKKYGGKTETGGLRKTFKKKDKTYIRLNLSALSGLIVEGVK